MPKAMYTVGADGEVTLAPADVGSAESVCLLWPAVARLSGRLELVCPLLVPRVATADATRVTPPVHLIDSAFYATHNR
jgi:hypothetical protein